MHYRVDPGLYALGNPDETSHVLVTANYKMSFDSLREVMPGRDAWILVLDTNGINVWCAAGKGTFGTGNLVRSIQACGLGQIVSHRKLVLPQLAGPGIAAHQVKRLSGFEVIYGPIRAVDLPAFLDSNMKATPKMRVKTFTMRERAVLIPIELVAALKAALIIIPLLLILSGLIGPAGFLANIYNHGIMAMLAVLAAVLAGTIFTPILLPWLPGRAFSLKGLFLGLAVSVVFMAFYAHVLTSWPGRLEICSFLFIIIAMVMYLAMNFTGASTYTSLSGVKKEMRWAVPVEISAGALGLGLWIWALIMA